MIEICCVGSGIKYHSLSYSSNVSRKTFHLAWYVSRNDFLGTDGKARTASVQESIIHSDNRRLILYVI